MQNKRIIITGGAGFIGSNLAKRLLQDNNKVIVIDDLSTGNYDNIKQMEKKDEIKFLKGTITDLNFLKKSFKDVDYVFHQAAIPSVPRSVKNPLKSHNANVNGTLNVLLAAKENNVKKIVYASSSSVYGDTPTLPKKEEMKPIPLSPYAVNKLVGEYYCKIFTNIYNLKTVCLRYFNVFGPNQDPDGDYAAVIPKFINRILSNKSLIIYGDGEQTRDFTFINDVVSANILAAESIETGVYNIAGGKRITINTLAKKLINITGKKVNINYSEARPGDILHSLADVSKANRKLDFYCDYDIDKGLKETFKWYSNKFKLKNSYF